MSSSDWTDAIAHRLIERAACRAPRHLADRLLEEWTADLSDHRGRMERLGLALGCYWAALLIKDDCCALSTSAHPSPMGDQIMIPAVPSGRSPISRLSAAPAREPPKCEINTTPLIDVLLVLIVTLVITLPMMTHAVKLNLPQSAAREAQPEVINLDIDFDGTVLWNGSAVASFEQLEGYFRAESRRVPQPEIHLRPDPHVKYGVVAQVLAAAQRNQLQKLGFVNSDQFAY
ncbi:MAG TPA: biopolymer transporter ExbD [Steroidobacteraceae bacterium]|nr:biopolymer transporter ExbD [Steroidobacteraceae bacterium]